MFLSNASVRRPIAVSALLIALVLLGLNAWRKIGLEQMPKMDIPYVTILTVYPGASPTEIETDVARKIEDAVSTIDGLNNNTSDDYANGTATSSVSSDDSDDSSDSSDSDYYEEPTGDGNGYEANY